jgi:hypothetical protein
MSLRVIWQYMDRSVTKKLLYGPSEASIHIIFFWRRTGPYTVKPRFIAPRFTAKLTYRQEFLQSRFPYVVITPLKCQTRIPPFATVIEDQTVNLLLFKPRS